MSKEWYHKNVTNSKILPLVKKVDVFTDTNKSDKSIIHSSILSDRSIVVKMKDLYNIIISDATHKHSLNQKDLNNNLKIYLDNNMYTIVDQYGNEYLSKEMLETTNNFDKNLIDQVSSSFTDKDAVVIKDINATKEILNYYSISNNVNNLKELNVEITAL